MMLSRRVLSRATITTRGLATLAPASVIPTQSSLQPPTLLEDLPASLDRTKLPSFTLSRARGFLPRDDPFPGLPTGNEGFNTVSSLLDRMTLVQPDGSKGLLALGQLGQAVHQELSSGHSDAGAALEKGVDKAIEEGNQDVLSALFRDMSFLTSAYLLEPVDLHFKATGTYCSGRDVLPAAIAKPFKKLADALGHFPYMEYASSYALQNWKRVDPAGGINYHNLRLIRAFENRAPTGSESGFILVHVDMVANSGALISSTEASLAAVANKSHKELLEGLTGVYNAYQKINLSMETMWGRSKPADYLAFRSFIFGTGPGKRLNAMFKNGVVYEGVSDEPTFFRGESGANDSMIPLGDNLLEITAHLPTNELTAILRDFRAYRPQTQRNYVESVEHRATSLGLRKFASEDDACLAMYVLCVDQIREFRDRHWRFTKSYILERTTYNIATGGSPIASYLPSNLTTVLNVLTDSFASLSPSALNATTLLPELKAEVEACRTRGVTQKRILEREVAKLLAAEVARKGMPMGVLQGAEVNLGHTSQGVEAEAQMPKVMSEKPPQRGAVGCDGVG